jgi:ribosomal protein S18 acetylase RimI-like enzyme
MVLDTLPEMAEAIRLYQSLGFVETNRYWDNPIDRTIYLGNTLGAGRREDPGRQGADLAAGEYGL